MLWPAEDDRQQSGLERTFNVDSRGSFSQSNLAPGHYHVCAVAVGQPWALMQDVALLKALASRCPTLDVAEGAHVNPQVPLIPADDLERIENGLEN